MMGKKLYILLMICCLLFSGCSSINSKQQSADNTFVLFKDIGTSENQDTIYDAYIKSEGQEKTRVASNVLDPNYTYRYVEGKRDLYLNDKNGDLSKFNDQNEREFVANRVEARKNYSVSSDNGTVVYIDQNGTLYVKEKDIDKKRILNNVINFKASKDAKYIYYMDSSNNLYLYNGESNEPIYENVREFEISENGEYVVFLDQDGYTIYIKNIKDQDKTEIPYISENVKSNIEVSDDGEVVFLDMNSYNDESYGGELYLYKENKLNDVAPDVKFYSKEDSKFYFLDIDDVLREKKLNDKKSNEIASNIDCFEIINNETPVYLTKDNNLFVGKDEIAQNIDNKQNLKPYATTSEIVVYLQDDAVHVYNLKNKKDTIEIKDAGDYSRIYLGDQQLYINYLDVDDLEGFWKVEPEDGDGYVLEFLTKENKLIKYRYGEENINYDPQSNDENSIKLYTDDGEEILINGSDNNNITININGDDENATKISEDKAKEIIDNMNKNHDFIIGNSDIDSYTREKIDEIIKDYEYYFVDAINTGDFGKVSEYLGGNLYDMQYDYVNNMYDKGTKETPLECKIINREKVNDREYRVTVYEKIEIRPKDKDSYVREYKTTYIISTDDVEYFYISDILNQYMKKNGEWKEVPRS